MVLHGAIDVHVVHLGGTGRTASTSMPMSIRQMALVRLVPAIASMVPFRLPLTSQNKAIRSALPNLGRVSLPLPDRWCTASDRPQFHAEPHLAVVGGGLVGLFEPCIGKRRHPLIIMSLSWRPVRSRMAQA